SARDPYRPARWRLLAPVVALVAIGALARIAVLGEPMRHDESCGRVRVGAMVEDATLLPVRLSLGFALLAAPERDRGPEWLHLRPGRQSRPKRGQPRLGTGGEAMGHREGEPLADARLEAACRSGGNPAAGRR